MITFNMSPKPTTKTNKERYKTCCQSIPSDKCWKVQPMCVCVCIKHLHSQLLQWHFQCLSIVASQHTLSPTILDPRLIFTTAQSDSWVDTH